MLDCLCVGQQVDWADKSRPGLHSGAPAAEEVDGRVAHPALRTGGITFPACPRNHNIGPSTLCRSLQACLLVKTRRVITWIARDHTIIKLSCAKWGTELHLQLPLVRVLVISTTLLHTSVCKSLCGWCAYAANFWAMNIQPR